MATMFAINPQPRDKSQTYWNEVAYAGNKLAADPEIQKRNGVVYITSEENRMNQVTGGRIFQVDIRTAGQRLVERTHRLSSPEEIAKYDADDKAEAHRLAEETARLKNTSTLQPSQAQMESQAQLIGAVVEAVLTKLAPSIKQEPAAIGQEPVASGRKRGD